MSVTASPGDVARLRAASRAFRQLPKTVKDDIRALQREQLGPIWKDEMGQAVAGAAARKTHQERIFGSGARVRAGLPSYLVAGASTRKLSGGGTPRDLARPYEFGTGRRDRYTRYYRTYRGGQRHTVTRRTSRQLPLIRRQGYVVYPAVSQTIPRYIGATVLKLTDRIRSAVERA